MREELFNHTQALQQAITTIVTCRTLIKYNSNLSTEQRTEILSEIEATLAILSQNAEANTHPDASSTLSPEQLADYVIPAENGSIANPEPSEAPYMQHELLHQIDQLYRNYLSKEPGKGLETIETRYKTVMNGLDQLQTQATLRSDTTASDLTIDELLNRVRGFVTALYSLFREFSSLFSRVIEGQRIEMDTEAMVFSSPGQDEAAPSQTTHDITSLVRVYENQCRLQQRRGELHDTVRDAIAFLIFLQENLEQTRTRRPEIVTQIKSIASLLNELLMLLKDYERAMEHIMQSPPKSH